MIEIIRPHHPIHTHLHLAGSKSISNRLLILNHIFNSVIQVTNCSDADDTENLKKALHLIQHTQSAEIDVHHAGTNMRFLTAYLAAKPGNWVLTGSERMKERPIAELVKALQQLGAHIKYLQKEGYPPLKIEGKKLLAQKITVQSNVSSQFVSALLLMSPLLEGSLEIELAGNTVSKPYISMSIQLMQEFGMKVEWNNRLIRISNKQEVTSSKTFTIESDWSSASYWYSLCALMPHSKIELNTFYQNSLQADSVLPRLYEALGVKTVFEHNKLILSHQGCSINKFEYDFIQCPDIAQTLAITCVGLGIEAQLNGLNTLSIKETNRIKALKTEIEKTGASVLVDEQSMHIGPTDVKALVEQTLHISTYHDHRMALSFAPLALICKSILMQDHEVINKSYHAFWHDLKSAGFSVNLSP